MISKYRPTAILSALGQIKMIMPAIIANNPEIGSPKMRAMYNCNQ